MKMRKIFILVSLLLITTTMLIAQDAAGEIKSLWEDQIQPILDVVLMIAVGIAGVWLLVLFFQGKKEALKQLGYVVGGAIVFRVLAGIVGGIVDRDLAFLPNNVSDALQVFWV
jgi:hypothetical protein